MSTEHTITIAKILSRQKDVSSLNPERWGDYCAHICYSDKITPWRTPYKKRGNNEH
jgi:hypothetical protein